MNSNNKNQESHEISKSTIITTFITDTSLFFLFIFLFVSLKTKFKRIYSPKLSFNLVPSDKFPDRVSTRPFQWVLYYFIKSKSYFIQKLGLDGFFFLRYLQIFALTFFSGILLWTILLPSNIINGRNSNGFDRLSISNVTDSDRYFAHLFCSWIFYSCVIFLLHREMSFYCSLRISVLSSPKYSSMLQSRTVLFQCVPGYLMKGKKFLSLFEGISRIYLIRVSRKLENLIKERNYYISKLEKAECKIIQKAVKRKNKINKKKDIESLEKGMEHYIQLKDRPSARSNGFLSQKIDVINTCKEKIPQLNLQIRELRKVYKKSKVKNSVFIEFKNQFYAQLAYQALIYHRPLEMSPKYTNLDPEDIQWKSLRIFWWERLARKFISLCIISGLILFWASPVAFIGLISNVNYLTKNIKLLRSLETVSHTSLSLITGFLPTVLLSILVNIVPIFIRNVAKFSGAISVQQIELFCQKAYFSFLFVNSFLITAFASSTASMIAKIMDSPKSLMSILASGLPKSSNFFISFIITQGLINSGGVLFQVVNLFLYYILGGIFDKTIRQKWNRFSQLGTVYWGNLYPIFTNLACITLSFSIISPIILIFSAATFSLSLIAYCYNLLFVTVSKSESQGIYYPQALLQTFLGIYIGQISLLGIFIFGKAWGPIILQIVGICFVICTHIHLYETYKSLLHSIPISCLNNSHDFSLNSLSSKNIVQDHEKKIDTTFDASDSEKKKSFFGLKNHKKRLNDNFPNNEKLSNLSSAFLQCLEKKKKTFSDFFNPIYSFFRPDLHLNIEYTNSLLPYSYNIETVEKTSKNAYGSPLIFTKCPGVWIPKDEFGFSAEEISSLKHLVNISDQNAQITNNGRVSFLDSAPN